MRTAKLGIQNLAMTVHFKRLAPRLLLIGMLGHAALQAAEAEKYFDRYGLTPASAALDLGVQPLGTPSGVISAVMLRDRLLRSALVNAGKPLKAHAFRRGADMVALLGDDRLEAGLLGDMPTILAASANQVLVVGLVKQAATAIVASGDTQVRGLAGKRIGYVPESSAHSTLLQGLASSGLTENDVKLVALGVDEMPDALARGDIEAFSAWEPAPSVALGRSDKNRVVFRGLSSDYFVINRDFEKNSPEAARLLVAGFVRAIEWMRASPRNLEAAARWAVADSQTFAGKVSAVTAQQIRVITRREILNIPSAPVILVAPGAPPPLKSEYEFLEKLGKLPAKARWDNVASAFRYDGLGRVQSEPSKFKVHSFDYEE